MNISQLIFGIKREYWEFQKTLFWLPVIMIALYVSVPLIHLIVEGGITDKLVHFAKRASTAENDLPYSQMYESIMLFFAAPFMFIALIVQIYYFTSCFFDEKRDLSIFFWRSLPVSDLLTITAKLVMGAIVIPLIFMAAATALYLLLNLVGMLHAVILSASYDTSLWFLWSNVDWLLAMITNLFYIVPFSLWFLPVFAWLMLASSYAKKAPFLWAVLPVVALVLVEFLLLKYTSLQDVYVSKELLNYFVITPEMFVTHIYSDETTHSAQFVSTNIDASGAGYGVLMDKVNVYGLIVAGVFLSAVYWLRKNVN